MKTHRFAQRWHERKTEWGLWWGFGGLILLPTAVSLALWLLPLWIVAGIAFAWLFFGSLSALVARDKGSPGPLRRAHAHGARQ